MARELKNASITHVSYVDKGANQKTFFFTKSDKKEHPDFKKHVEVFVNKDEAEQQLVYGVVYEPDVEDSHGDFMTAHEIEKAAHGFLKDARNIDAQHDFQEGVGEVVESYIAPCDMEIGGHDIAKGSWVLVTKATEEIWDSIKKGEYTGYSMAGKAETIEKQATNPVSAPNESEMTGFFNALKRFFSKESVNKAGKQISAANQKKIKDAHELLSSLVTSDEEETEMKKEDFEKMLDDKFSPIEKRLEELEKQDNPEAGDEASKTGKEEDLVKQLGDILDQKLAPLAERIEKVEQVRGVTKQAIPEEEKIAKSHYLDGIL